MTHEHQEVLNKEFLGIDLTNFTDLDILELVIGIATKNGWENPEGIGPMFIANRCFIIKDYAAPNYLYEIDEMLFNHDFAKALWGSEAGYITRAFKPSGNQLYGEEVPAYKYHLTRLALEKDQKGKFEYIRNNLIV